MIYTSKLKKIHDFVYGIALVVFTPFLCLTNALAGEVDEARIYELSRVLVTPIQRQWIEPVATSISKVKIEIFDVSSSLDEKSKISENELPVGLPIKVVDLAEFTMLKMKKTVIFIGGMEAILYQDTIYLLE